MYLINALLIAAMLFFFFLPITDYRTAQMKLCVLYVLVLGLTVSVAKTQTSDPRVASSERSVEIGKVNSR